MKMADVEEQSVSTKSAVSPSLAKDVNCTEDEKNAHVATKSASPPPSTFVTESVNKNLSNNDENTSTSTEAVDSTEAKDSLAPTIVLEVKNESTGTMKETTVEKEECAKTEMEEKTDAIDTENKSDEILYNPLSPNNKESETTTISKEQDSNIKPHGEPDKLASKDVSLAIEGHTTLIENPQTMDSGDSSILIEGKKSTGKPDMNQNAQSENQAEDMQTEITDETKKDNADLSRNQSPDEVSQMTKEEDIINVKDTEMTEVQNICSVEKMDVEDSSGVSSLQVNTSKQDTNEINMIQDELRSDEIKNVENVEGPSIVKKVDDEISETEPAQVKHQEMSTNLMMTEETEQTSESLSKPVDEVSETRNEVEQESFTEPDNDMKTGTEWDEGNANNPFWKYFSGKAGSEMDKEEEKNRFWMYYSGYDEPEEIKEAALKVAKQADFSPSYEKECKLDVIISEGEIRKRNVNFSLPDKQICIQEDPNNISISANHIRYVSVKQLQEQFKKRYDLRCSYRSMNEIHNIVFTFGDAVESIYYLNLFYFLMSTFHCDSLLCVLKDFQPKITLTECSVIVSAEHQTQESDATVNGKLTEQEGKYICTLDIEGIYLLTDKYARKPSYALFFYEDQSSDVDVVDRIVVENGKVSVTSQRLKVVFPKLKEEIPEMINILKNMRPSKRKTFEDRRPVIDREEEEQSVWKANFIPSAAAPVIDVKEEDLSLLTSQLSQGVLQCRSVEESFQEMWMIAESSSQSIIKNGFVPEKDVMSGGIDPDSVEHLRNYIQAIEDDLMNQSYPEAISKTKGLKTVFAESKYEDIKKLTQEYELDLMKKIFFRQFVQL